MISVGSVLSLTQPLRKNCRKRELVFAHMHQCARCSCAWDGVGGGKGGRGGWMVRVGKWGFGRWGLGGGGGGEVMGVTLIS